MAGRRGRQKSSLALFGRIGSGLALRLKVMKGRRGGLMGRRPGRLLKTFF